MPDNEITLLVGTDKLKGWKTVSVNRALDALADTFDFSMVDVWGDEDSPLVPYEECKIYIEKTTQGQRKKSLVLTGYIDTVDIKAESRMLSVKINGRSKTCDLVDCSAEYLPSNSWNNTQLSTIIRDLMFPYNVDLDFISSSASGNDANLSLTVNAGETIYEIIGRECRKRGIFPVTNPSGNLELITTGDRISQDKIILGENIVEASIVFDYANRFGTYKVKAQKQGKGDAWINSTNQIGAESTDSVFGSRSRTKIIVLDGTGTIKDAQNTANWEAQVRAGKTGKLVVKIPSWHQSNGELWEVGTLVYCDIPPLKIREQLLVNNINFSQDDGGTVAQLELVNADTYSPSPTKITKVTKKSKKKGFGFGW